MSSYDYRYDTRDGSNTRGQNWGVGMGYSGGAGTENRSYDSTGYSSYGDVNRNSTFGFAGDRGNYGQGGNYTRTETTTYSRDSGRDRDNDWGKYSTDRHGSSGNYLSSSNRDTGYTGYGQSGYSQGTGYGSSDNRYNTSTYYGSGYGSGLNTGMGSTGYLTGGYGSNRYDSSTYGLGNQGYSGSYSDRRDFSTGSGMRYGSEHVRDTDRYSSGSYHPSNYNSYYGNTGSSRNDYGHQSSALSRYDNDRSSNRSNYYNQDRSTSAYGGNYGSSYTTDRTVDRSFDRSRNDDNDQGFFASIGNWMSNLIGLTDKSSTGGSSRTIRPQIVEESGVKKVQYNFDVRGFSPENVNLTASGQRIEVTATQEDKDDDHHVRREYRRVITVPEGIKVESFKSRVLQNGVLRVEAPIQVDQLTADQQRSLLGEIPITKGALTSSSSTTGSSGYGTTGGKTTTTTEHVRETTKTSS